MYSKLKTLKSFTLLEIIISVTIFSLVALGISLVFQRSLFVFRASTDKNQASQQAQIATEWLARDIGAAYGIFVAKTGEIALVNPNQQYIKYYLEGDQIKRKECVNPDYLLAENVAGFSLKYYDINNQPIVANPFDKALSLKTVEINITTQKNNQKFKLNTVAGFEYDSACSWAKIYGGTGSDTLYALQQASDEGYILGGLSNSFGTNTTLVIKTAKDGTVGAGNSNTWAMVYSFLGEGIIYSLEQTDDNADGVKDDGYILGGYSGGNAGCLLIKINSSGILQWLKTYSGSGVEGVKSVKQTKDGGYILGGNTNSFGGGPGLAIKTDSLGALQWAKTYGSFLSVNALQQASDEGYILGGGVGLAKVDPAGMITWAKIYDNISISCLQQTGDGGYILGGITSFFGAGGQDGVLIKTDSNGMVTWARAYGGSGSDFFRSLQQTGDGGGYIVGGDTASWSPGGNNFWVIKTDPNGIVNWSKIYGNESVDSLESLQQASDEGYILGGHTNFFAGKSKFFTIKIDSSGNTGCCSFAYSCSPVTNNITASLQVYEYPDATALPNFSIPPTVLEYPDTTALPNFSEAPIILEYPDTTALPNFPGSITTKQYDGSAPDDFILTTNLICPPS